MRAGMEELDEHLDRYLSEDGRIDIGPGLAVYRYSAPMGPIYRVSEPSLCVMARGAKDVFLGKGRYRYDASTYLFVTAAAADEPRGRRIRGDIARLARTFRMSPSTFHQHFTSATTMRPLQFQKQLRLQEARRLLVGTTTTTRRISAANTSACSASRRRVTSSGCARLGLDRKPVVNRVGARRDLALAQGATHGFFSLVAVVTMLFAARSMSGVNKSSPSDSALALALIGVTRAIESGAASR
jgi:AraC-like DNA-binding protein